MYGWVADWLMQRTANPFRPVRFRSRPHALILIFLFLVPLPSYSKNQSPHLKILRLGDTDVKVFVHQPQDSMFFFVNLHQNEVTSKEAGKIATKQRGGQMVYITHGDEKSRNIKFHIKNIRYEIDPNRIFSDKGIKDTLKMYGAYSSEAFHAVKKFSKRLLLCLDTNKMIIALHNNQNPERYSFQSYFESPLLKDVAMIHSAHCNAHTRCYDGSGEFFYTTSKKVFLHLKKKEIFNIALQNNRNATDDGSLSIYAGKNLINYTNVEARLGNLEEQTQMLLTLMNHSAK